MSSKTELSRPFVPSPSPTHCWPACFAMLAHEILPPSHKTDWNTIDRITHKPPDSHSIITAGMLYLLDNNWKTRIISDFDWGRFSTEPKKYLIQKYGPNILQNLQNFDYRIEAELVNILLTNYEHTDQLDITKKIPSLNDIAQLIDNGWQVCVSIDSTALNQIKGRDPTNHFVLVNSCCTVPIANLPIVVITDPGPVNPQDNRLVYPTIFEQAFDNNPGIYAFKPPPTPTPTYDTRHMTSI